MADAESSQPQRRSQRDKKIVKHFVSTDGATTKRKRNESETEDDVHDLTDFDDARLAEDEADEEDEYAAPQPKPKTAPNAKKGKANPKGPSPTKKPRTTKASTLKAPKATTRRTKKPKADGDAFDAAQIANETKINTDNPLFNTLLNPSAALQSKAEDFLESLGQTPGPAQAELVTCILRACGCNDSVDQDKVLDYDGVLDSLDDFTENLKQDNSPVYPLTSKLTIFKKFRKSLSEFLGRLTASAAEMGSLYTTDLITTIQQWVVAMSSSQLRSFRHTATVIALELETALCDVAASVEKEAEVVGRQREGEKKRKATNKGTGVREKELESKAQEIRERRSKLAEFIKEFVDGVFIHRYRDLDPTIRAECVRALGLWFKKYPGHFLDSSYLRYVGWVLSDASTQVRLEAVKALSGVYEQVDYIGSLNLFTERFKPRMIEMASGDTELGVRVAVIQVLGAIDRHSLLEDEEREKLCLLVFDEEPRVRKAVGGFVKGVWEDSVEERMVAKRAGGKGQDDEKESERAGAKALAALLVKWGKALDEATDDGDEDSDGQGRPDGGVRESNRRFKEVAATVASGQKGRTALAVEALWAQVDPVSDWAGLLDFLLLDHSAPGEDQARGRSKAARRRPATAGQSGTERLGDDAVDEAWRLVEEEESVLLEVLVASLRRARADHASSKKGADEQAVSDFTRALMKALPRLFIKHQTDETRIAELLLIPPLMNLDLYLEMRMITAYASLWDDVGKQFLSHSSMIVLTNAATCIWHFMDTTSLSNTNSTKILELEDELSSSLRDTVAGRDEIEVASFSEDEVLALDAICSRLAVLAGTRDMTAWIEENEGGKQSSAWDIVSALVERGRLGYKEEEHMIEQALNLLNLHIIWKARGLTADGELSAEEIRSRETLREQMDALLEKLVEYAVGTQSNTAEGVKRTSFQILLNLHILFCPSQTVAEDGGQLPTASLAMTMDDEVQYRCAGYIQAEIERYADEIDEGAAVAEGEKQDGDSHSSDDENENEEKEAPQGKGKGKAPKAKKGGRDVDNDLRRSNRTRLSQEYVFMGVVTTFLRAVRAGVLHIRHCAGMLTHYGRLGSSFDICAKVVVDILREEGMYNKNGEVVVEVISRALKESFNLVMNHVVHGEANTIALAKIMSSCLALRGAQLAIVQRLDSQFVVQLHTDLLAWIGKRIASCEASKNKKARNSAVSFFKVLVPLLVTIESRDALRIKAYMDQVLAQAKVEVSPTSKVWEPQRAYEKRLTTAMKDKAAGPKGRKAKSGQVRATTSSGEETEMELLAEGGEPSVRPRRKPSRRSARLGGSGTDSTLTELGETEPSANEAEVAAQNARPRPRPAYKPQSLMQTSGDLPPASPPHPSHVGINGASPSAISRKRGHSDVEGEPTDLPDAADAAESDNEIASPVRDMQIRKRVRH